MTTASLRASLDELVDDLGITADDIAGSLGVDLQTVERWRCGLASPEGDTRSRVDQLVRAVAHLHRTFTTAEARLGWLHMASNYLGGRTRADVLRGGEFERVDLDLIGLDYGIFD